MDRDLRRLKRKELVEVIYQQHKDADSLEEENKALKDQLAKAKERYLAQLAGAQEENGAKLRTEDMARIDQSIQGMHDALLGIDREIRSEYKGRISQLERECEMLQRRLDARLEIQQNAGSLAEAVVGLNNIFANAQQAADQYVSEMAARSESTEEAFLKAKTKADLLLREAEEAARARQEQAEAAIREKQTEFQAQHKAMLQIQEAFRTMMGQV